MLVDVTDTAPADRSPSAARPDPFAPRGAPVHGIPGLRIAMVAPPYFEVPPAGYGGVEAVVADLVAMRFGARVEW